MTSPTPDEAAALADAETYTRAMAERRKHHGALAAFVAEYDRRAEEIAALRAEVERARGIEQQARALSLRNDRLYSLFVDATGYEPNLELGDDDDQ